MLTEGGDDVVLTIGQNNVVMSGSGNDVVAAFGKENWIAAGGGADIILAVGKRNMIAADNEITFSTEEITELKKGTGNMFQDKDEKGERSGDPVEGSLGSASF